MSRNLKGTISRPAADKLLARITAKDANGKTVRPWIPLDPSMSDDDAREMSLFGVALSGLVGVLMFVPLWAGMNFAFGTALDGPVGAFVMEPPCQRLVGTNEPLSRYSLSANGKGRLSSSLCHFGSRTVPVDGRIEELGFAGRELVYLVAGLVGYAACFAGALALAIIIPRAGMRVFAKPVGRLKG